MAMGGGGGVLSQLLCQNVFIKMSLKERDPTNRYLLISENISSIHFSGGKI